eukprot:comp19197_c0_seq1/m.21920 comp19197_c0_seq1/g.21920  ORF comp19197_c0_seq1/g.21920 comp19197_c0_seq1/m.21920 type:complete len:368 (-) comp19197_c0_seq1:533-1636(-)
MVSLDGECSLRRHAFLDEKMMAVEPIPAVKLEVSKTTPKITHSVSRFLEPEPPKNSLSPSSELSYVGSSQGSLTGDPYHRYPREYKYQNGGQGSYDHAHTWNARGSSAAYYGSHPQGNYYQFYAPHAPQRHNDTLDEAESVEANSLRRHSSSTDSSKANYTHTSEYPNPSQPPKTRSDPAVQDADQTVTVAATADECCSNCQTKSTTLWRRSASGSILCNACGLYERLHGTARPRGLCQNPIRKRNRKSSAAKAAAMVPGQLRYVVPRGIENNANDAPANSQGHPQPEMTRSQNSSAHGSPMGHGSVSSHSAPLNSNSQVYGQYQGGSRGQSPTLSRGSSVSYDGWSRKSSGEGSPMQMQHAQESEN